MPADEVMSSIFVYLHETWKKKIIWKNKPITFKTTYKQKEQETHKKTFTTVSLNKYGSI